MPNTRRQIADDLAEDAHAILAGADPSSIIQRLEYRIQDLQEISDIEDKAQEPADEADKIIPGHD